MSIASYHAPFLRQGLRLLETLPDELYRAPADGAGAGAGAHFRHVIDYYQAFLNGLEKGRIDYDRRRRDPRLETRAAAARDALRDLRDRLEELAVPGDLALEVRVDAAAHAGGVAWSRSSAARELSFLLSHTVHHYALIARILRAAGLELDEELGVAPSTLEYQKTAHAVEAG